MGSRPRAAAGWAACGSPSSSAMARLAISALG